MKGKLNALMHQEDAEDTMNGCSKVNFAPSANLTTNNNSKMNFDENSKCALASMPCVLSSISTLKFFKQIRLISDL